MKCVPIELFAAFGMPHEDFSGTGYLEWAGIEMETRPRLQPITEQKVVLDEMVERSQTDADYANPHRVDLGPMIRFPNGPNPNRVYRKKPGGGIVRVRGIKPMPKADDVE